MATLCDSDAVKLKAGANVSTAITAGQYTQMINQAEADVCVESGYNWVDDYANINVDVKQILEDATSSKAAVIAINYDMSGYTSRVEAQTMLDVNEWVYNNAIKKLKDKVYVERVKDL